MRILKLRFSLAKWKYVIKWYMKALQFSNFIKQWGAFFIISFLGFGTSFYCIKIALLEITALEVATYRVTIASLCLVAIVLIFKIPLPRDMILIARIGLSGIIGIFTPFILVTWAQHHISSSVSGILNSLVPIFTVILSAIFLPGKDLNVRLVCSVILGFFGAILIFIDKLNTQVAMQSILPEMAVISAAFCYAAQGIYAKIYFKNENFIALSTISTTTAGIFLWAVLLLSQDSITFPKQSNTITSLIWMALISTTLSQILLFYLIKSWTPTRVSFIAYIIPIVAMSLGVFALKESLHLSMIIGASIIIFSIVLSNHKIKPRAK